MRTPTIAIAAVLMAASLRRFMPSPQKKSSWPIRLSA